jgi:NADH-quinone oxidoreductase subunit L
MLDWLWLVPTLPLAGFTLLALAGGRLTRRGIAWIGAGSVDLSAILAYLVASAFLNAFGTDGAYSQTLWTWMELEGFRAAIDLHLDRLSLVMMLVITGVGTLIHIYAAEYMADDEGYRRFFAYMNLFVAFMLVLVLAGDLLLLFLGWEGVGLCSYLLIGFWYQDADNGRAARKAFVVTRIGDAAFLAGLLVLFTGLGSTQIEVLLARASSEWPWGSGLAVAAAVLLLGGAVGKSAQLPLQVWLPDAMAGPTPVSALIHAATMVTAGVYLIGRMLPLFAQAPQVLALVGTIGAITLLLAALSALGQRDLKRILAYSTVSQIGYMFLALGVGSVSAALFHLMMHAFFKALLFLSAGTVIMSFDGEHDVFRMGGLRRERPVAFWGFLIGAASLAALPLVTAGFYSKELILSAAWSGPWSGDRVLWGAGALGAFLTGLYIFRPVFLVFFGEPKSKPTGHYGPAMSVPILLLAVLAVGGGWIGVPAFLGRWDLAGAYPTSEHIAPELVAVALGLLGILVAYWIFQRSSDTERLAGLFHFSRGGLGFDALYERLLVRPFLGLAWANRQDLVDLLYEGLAQLARRGNRLLSLTQTGVLRWYARATVLGGVLVVATLILWAELL